MTMHNVDNILTNQSPQIPPTKEPPIQKEEVPVHQDEKQLEQPIQDPISTENESPDEKISYIEQFQKDKEEFLGKKEENVEEKVQNKDEGVDIQENKPENNQEVDEYGNQLPKKKLYTEEEVNQKIRERLSRGKFAQEQNQQIQQQVQQATKDFKSDPESSESWEQQLESFVVNTVSKLQTQQQEQAWKQKEQQIQQEFEVRFTTGMERFQDFREVVGSKPITNSMMMATRNMKDPASFIYAASKQQPKELERISAIPDPYQQAAEMGRLEERMKKARSISNAPKPASKIKSDVNISYNENPSVDQRIQADAKRKLNRGGYVR